MGTGNISNKFKFISLAAARCSQLQRGAKPKLEVKSRKLVTIAQEEVRQGLVEDRAHNGSKGDGSSAVATLAETEDVG